MQRAATRTGQGRARVALALAGFALLMRLLVPAGWMPAAGDGYAITLCTGAGMVSAWVDAQGDVHEQVPHEGGKTSHPCVFAGFGAALDLATPPAPLLPLLAAATPLALPSLILAIGRGLAAPPPPPTGPPASR